MTWLDFVILTVLAYFAYVGYKQGLLHGLLELVGIIVSIGIPFFLYIPAGKLLERLGVSQIYSGALAFLIIWFITLNLYFLFANRFYRRVPRGVRRSRANKALGIIPGIVRGIIVVSVLLAIVVALPTPLISQNIIEKSPLATPMLDVTTEMASYAADIFGEAIRNIPGFITIEPEAGDRVTLPFHVENPVVDQTAENQMLYLVNRERISRGLRPLVMDQTIRKVARQHSADMFRQGYFSHESLDGRSPYRRMRNGGVRYTTAGENIALAPTVKIAHSGLMNSPGHRENILRPSFRRIGIGAARGGRRGIMFTQDFAN